MPPLPTQEENFDSATEKFDLDELKTAMEADKQGKISDAPWRYFKGVLCGSSTTDVARICGVQPKTVSVALNRGIKDHLWQVLQRSEDEKLGDWKDAVGWLIGSKFDLLQKRPTDWQEVCRVMWQKQKKDQQIRRKVTERGFEVNVHVELGLVQREQQQRRQGNQFNRSQIYDLTDREAIVRRFEHGEFLAEVIEQPPKVDKHVAIIGEPGAGKTTLLAAIADRLSHYNSKKLPICISLAGLQKKPLQDYLLQTWLPEAFHLVYTDIALDETHRIAFQNWLRQGEVWLLLDGVDEMGEEYPATALNTIKTQLIGWLGNVRVALTCRSNVWDAQLNNPLSGAFDVYKTQEFKPKQIEEFIQQWFSQSKKPERGQALQLKLNEPQRERIRELVRNPLRLSLLCQAFYTNPNEYLPQTKAGLYEIFVRDFYEWKLEQHPTKEPQREKLNKALGKLALGGLDNENGLHRFRLPEKAARKVMGNKQFELAEKLGWLNIVDQDADSPQAVYAFFHPTFQEYFAALAINDWDDFLPSDHQDKPTKNRKGEMRYRIFEPQWKEVIFLWLGRSDEQLKVQQEKLVKKLANFEDSCRDFYNFRAYFLAAAGISELDDFPQACEIVDQLLNWGLGYQRIFSHIGDAPRAILQETNRNTLSKALVKLLESEDKSSVHNALDYIYEYPVNTPEIYDALIPLLEAEDERIRCEAACCLERVKPGNAKATHIILNSLKSRDYRLMVARCLGDASAGKSNYISILRGLLSPPVSFTPVINDIFYYMVACSLLKLNPGDEIAIRFLNFLLNQTWSDYLHWHAAQALEANSVENLSDHNSLNSKDPFINILIDNLEKLGLGRFKALNLNSFMINQHILPALTSLLSSSQSEEVHQNVAYCLEIIFSANRFEIQAESYKLVPKGFNNCSEKQVRDNSTVLWHCAQNMSYPEFYAAWHSALSTTDSAAVADRPS